MKDNSAPVITSGNIVAFKTREAGIDAEGMKYIFSVLSNQYSNKEKAVLREYTTNAWDSHISAGNNAPIEVTLPSMLQPTLLIQDYGLGLSQDEVLVLLGDYGASTKRGSNDTVGKMGIGSKSAISLVSQYVVTAVKDGLKNVVLFALNENGILESKVVKGGIPTEEPNGVLISLSVEDVDAMNREAETFFSKWVPGRVLVNGQEPACVWDDEDTNRLSDTAYIVPEHDGTVFAVMGQISYEVSRDLLRKVRDKFEVGSTARDVTEHMIDWYEESALFLHVGIGDVDIAPSRETLMDSLLTVNTLCKAVEGIAATLTAKVQADVDAEPNAYAAIRKFEEVRSALKPLKVQRKDVTYHGLRMKESQKIHLPSVFLSNHYGRRGGARTIVAMDSSIHVSCTDFQHALVIKVKDETEAASVKRYAKRFLEASEYKWLVLAVGIDAASFGWFTFGGAEGGAPMMTIEEYRAACKELRSSDVSYKREPSYSTGWGSASTNMDDRDLLSDIVSWGKDLIAYHGSAHAEQYVRDALVDYTIVVLNNQQSLSALRKRVESDGTVRILDDTERQQIVADHLATLFSVTDDEKEAIGAYQWFQRNIGTPRYTTATVEDYVKYLGEENITSRTFRDALDTVALARLMFDAVGTKRIEEIVAMAKSMGKSPDEYVTEFDVDFTDVTVTMPMLGSVPTYSLKRNEALREDVLAYINAR